MTSKVSAKCQQSHTQQCLPGNVLTISTYLSQRNTNACNYKHRPSLRSNSLFSDTIYSYNDFTLEPIGCGNLILRASCELRKINQRDQKTVKKRWKKNKPRFLARVSGGFFFDVSVLAILLFIRCADSNALRIAIT